MDASSLRKLAETSVDQIRVNKIVRGILEKCAEEASRGNTEAMFHLYNSKTQSFEFDWTRYSHADAFDLAVRKAIESKGFSISDRCNAHGERYAKICW